MLRVSQRRGYTVSIVNASMNSRGVSALSNLDRIGLILPQSRQRADANQIIAEQAFGNANDENEVRALLIFAEWNAGAAAPDADHNFINQIRAGMWKHNAVFDDARMRLLTSEHLFEKSFGFADFPAADVGREYVHDLAYRIRRFSRAQPEDHLLFR